MSNETKEWIAVAISLLFYVAVFVIEVFWLIRYKWGTAGKSIAFVMVSNLLSFIVGGFVSFVILGVMLAMAWDGSINKISGGDFTLWVALIVAFAFPPLTLILTKRILL